MELLGIEVTVDRVILVILVILALILLIGVIGGVLLILVLQQLQRLSVSKPDVVTMPPAQPLFADLPNGSMQARARSILGSSIIGIYDDDTPVCAAIFISESRAISAEHDASPTIGAILHGRSQPDLDQVRRWEFRVVGVSKADDLVVLERIKGPPPADFLPFHDGMQCDGGLLAQRVLLATFGIATAARAGETTGSIGLRVQPIHARVTAVGHRHFAYDACTGPGDSGSAVFTLDGQLIGLHLGGWNYADLPPPSPPSKAGAGHAAAAAAQKNRERLVAMGLDHVGAATQQSVINLTRTITTGGYALFLTKNIVDAAVQMSTQPNNATASLAAASAPAGASAPAVSSARSSDSVPVKKRAGRKRSRSGSRGSSGSRSRRGRRGQ